MNKKWSSNKVKELQQWLESRWPLLFSHGTDRKPLALDIHKEILKFRSENPVLSSRTLDEALNRHMHSYGYLYGMLKHSHRYDLNGEKAEAITPQHKQWANRLLRAKQKEAQRIRKIKKKQGLVANKVRPAKRQHPVPAKMGTVQSAGTSATAPVIRYKQRRKRVIVRPAEVELAS